MVSKGPSSQTVDTFLTATSGHQGYQQMPKNPEDRPLQGTGVYEFSSKFEEMELGDSDNYSDDFYSDDFEGQEEGEEDGEFAFRPAKRDGAALQGQVNKGLQDVVNRYAQYLENQSPTDTAGQTFINQ